MTPTRRYRVLLQHGNAALYHSTDILSGCPMAAAEVAANQADLPSGPWCATVRDLTSGAEGRFEVDVWKRVEVKELVEVEQ